MKRRKTVSVTPAMGARTVAGAMRTLPMLNEVGKVRARVGCGDSPVRPGIATELSQNFPTALFYRSFDLSSGVRQCQRIEVHVVQKLRDILLTRYIGSILIALLCWQALIVGIEKVVRIVLCVIYSQRSHTAFESPQSLFPWDNLILSAVSIALYLLTAYVLAQWLYPPEVLPPVPPIEDAEESLRPPVQP